MDKFRPVIMEITGLYQTHYEYTRNLPADIKPYFNYKNMVMTIIDFKSTFNNMFPDIKVLVKHKYDTEIKYSVDEKHRYYLHDLYEQLSLMMYELINPYYDMYIKQSKDLYCTSVNRDVIILATFPH